MRAAMVAASSSALRSKTPGAQPRTAVSRYSPHRARSTGERLRAPAISLPSSRWYPVRVLCTMLQMAACVEAATMAMLTYTCLHSTSTRLSASGSSHCVYPSAADSSEMASAASLTTLLRRSCTCAANGSRSRTSSGAAPSRLQAPAAIKLRSFSNAALRAFQSPVVFTHTPAISSMCRASSRAVVQPRSGFDGGATSRSAQMSPTRPGRHQGPQCSWHSDVTRGCARSSSSLHSASSSSSSSCCCCWLALDARARDSGGGGAEAVVAAVAASAVVGRDPGRAPPPLLGGLPPPPPPAPAPPPPALPGRCCCVCCC